MTAYIIRRILIFIPMLLMVSIISFVVIQLPPGSFIEEKMLELEAQGGAAASIVQMEQLEARYGLDKPMYEQYLIWIYGIVTRGDFGESFLYNQEVNQIVWSYIGYTFLISFCSLLLVYLIAIPLGVAAAMHQGRPTDTIIGVLGFIGMSMPEFLVALGLLVFGLFVLDYAFIGLFSPEFEMAPWSWAKVMDLIKHLWIPAFIVALNGTAGLVRIMRSSLLETLGQPFVRAARAKGLRHRAVVGKHGLRVAINPLISILGMSLPALFSGSAIISIVLNLPTAGLLLFEGLRVQDMYLAGTLILIMSATLLLGNLLADIALAIADPRIRHE